MELQALRRLAIVEIESYLRRNISGSTSTEKEADGIPAAGACGTRSKEQTQQSLCTVPSSSAHWRGYMSTPTSTCSDVGTFMDSRNMQDLPACLSPTSTMGSLPPLDLAPAPTIKNQPELYHRPRQYRSMASSSLEEIPEMKSYTMPDLPGLRSMDELFFQDPSLSSLPEIAEEQPDMKYNPVSVIGHPGSSQNTLTHPFSNGSSQGFQDLHRFGDMGQLQHGWTAKSDGQLQSLAMESAREKWCEGDELFKAPTEPALRSITELWGLPEPLQEEQRTDNFSGCSSKMSPFVSLTSSPF